MKKDVSFILVTRKTRLQELVERFNTWAQARFYLEHKQVDTEDYLVEHDHYQSQVQSAKALLSNLGRLHVLERGFLSNYQFGENDTVIVIGQDGLVANTLKYLSGQPVIAINPDPDRFDGKLLPFQLSDLDLIAQHAALRDVDTKAITFAEARTNDGQQMLAVNDLFIGPKSHTSARYQIQWNGKSEYQSSSGIIISTGFGSTGWFQSILAGAMGISGQKDHEMEQGFEWDSPKLQFAVREPFPSLVTDVNLVFGSVNKNSKITIESHMPENGVVFSDGIESDYLAFNSGAVISVGVSKTKGCLVTR